MGNPWCCKSTLPANEHGKESYLIHIENFSIVLRENSLCMCFHFALFSLIKNTLISCFKHGEKCIHGCQARNSYSTAMECRCQKLEKTKTGKKANLQSCHQNTCSAGSGFYPNKLHQMEASNKTNIIRGQTTVSNAVYFRIL